MKEVTQVLKDQLKTFLPYKKIKILRETFVYRPLHVCIRECCFLFMKPSQKTKILSPIFIVGCGHSGTSIMLALLDAHSKIEVIPDESWVFFRNILKRIYLLRKWDTISAKTSA